MTTGPIIRVTPEEVHIKDSSYFSTIYSSAPTKRDKHHMIALIGGDLKSGMCLFACEYQRQSNRFSVCKSRT